MLSLSFGGTVTDIDGNVYNTIQIGSQNWVQENLKVTQYRNGEAIPTGLDVNAWLSTTEGAYANYYDDPNNAAIYGNLYNWYTVDDERGLCPEGFHVPSDNEWTTLERSICSLENDDDSCETIFPYDDLSVGWRGTDEGGKMKEEGTEHWYPPNTGATNESGFTAFPGGWYYSPGESQFSSNGITFHSYFWSSTEYNNNEAWIRSHNHDESRIFRTWDNAFKNRGHSIRCVENPPVQGCTDPEATNYDPSADIDDGSCCIELWGECYNIEETTNLNLSNSGLTGEIPVEIGQLTSLTSLSLYTNELTGEIPVEIGNLTNMHDLYLHDNQLSGEIPSELGNLTNLSYLYLYSNELIGLIPISFCSLPDDIVLLFSDNYLCPVYPKCLSDGSIGEQDTSECYGCTDPAACNYNPDVFTDDGSCWCCDCVMPGSGDETPLQDAIDFAVPGEEILLAYGTYTEDVRIEKDITLKSIIGAENTIIDGSRSLGSAIVILPNSTDPYNPIVELDSLTIINGVGTYVENKTITLADGTHPTEKVGGGLLVYASNVKVNNCKFENNGNNSTDKGGAVFAASDSDDIGILIRDSSYVVHPDLPPANSLDFNNNTFSGNNAKEAKSAYILGFEEDSIYFNNGNFDVYGYESSMVSKYWFKSSGNNMTFENGEGQLPGNEEGNIYVSLENGNNECNGDENCPVLSIDKALSLAIPNHEDPYDILISSGNYSINTSGEQFPLQTIDFVDLIAVDDIVSVFSPSNVFIPDAIESEIINILYYNQSSQQAFYFFITVSLNGYIFQDENSIVAAFRCLDWNDDFTECLDLGLCVGWRSWDTSQCGSGVCEVPVMGVDYEWTEGYMTPGDIPAFVLYHSEIGFGQGFSLEPIEGFVTSGNFVHEQLVSCIGEYTYNPDSGECELITVISGDLNGDGLINVLDIVVLVNIVLGNTEPLGDGDLNDDGVLNILDVVMLVNIILNG